MVEINNKIYWFVLITLGTHATMDTYNYFKFEKILVPKNEQVGQNYVQPNKLENITVEDLGDGKKRTILEYNGNKFLFMLDEKGKPYTLDFSIKPAEIKPLEVVTQEYKIK